MGLQKVERVRKFLVFEYDATVDGGAAGSYVMRNQDSLNGLEAGLVLLDAFANVITARTGAGTIDVGDGTTADKYFATATIAGAAAGSIAAPQAAVKLSLTEAGKLNPTVTIGVGGVTAYKIRAYFEYVKPL